jgi:hypothetical protein
MESRVTSLLENRGRKRHLSALKDWRRYAICWPYKVK